MPQSFGLYAGALMESGGFSGWTAQSMSRKELWFQRLMNQTQRLGKGSREWTVQDVHFQDMPCSLCLCQYRLLLT